MPRVAPASPGYGVEHKWDFPDFERERRSCGVENRNINAKKDKIMNRLAVIEKKKKMSIAEAIALRKEVELNFLAHNAAYDACNYDTTEIAAENYRFVKKVRKTGNGAKEA